MQKGDVVQLKSGGPHMNLAEKMPNGDWKCHWVLERELKEGFFPLESLIPALSDAKGQQKA